MALVYLLCGLVRISAYSNSEWSSTVKIGLDLSMKTQSTFTKWLMVVKGIDAAENWQSMTQDFAQFDTDLQDLMTGNSSRKIIPPPTALMNTTIQAVFNLWSSYKNALLNQDVNLVRNNVTGVVNETTISVYDTANLALIDATDTFIARLVSTAKLTLEFVDSPQKLIAGRQPTMLYRAYKRILLIGLNSVDNVPDGANRLKGNRDSFATSHLGIIWGASWAGFPTGIPQLTKICTLKQMRTVTYHWNRFLNNVIQPVLTQRTSADIRATASKVAQTAARLSQPLVKSLTAARDLYSDDDGTCITGENFTKVEWATLVELSGKQEYLIENVAMLLAQVAIKIDVFQTSVKLALSSGQLTAGLQNLIEGSQELGIQSPPSQNIADNLITANDFWQSMSSEVTKVSTTTVVEKDTLQSIASASDFFLKAVAEAMKLYQKKASSSITPLTAQMIYMTREQCMLLPKIAKEASLILYGESPSYYWVQLNKSRDDFLTNHRQLLTGAQATNQSVTLNKTSNACAIRLMKKVADSFAALEQAALQAANNNTLQAGRLVALTESAVSAMETASPFYTNGSVTCDAYNASFDEWRAGLVEVGHLREMMQKVLYSFITSVVSNSSTRRLTWKSNNLLASISETQLCLDNLKFGNGALNIPAPPNDAILNQMFQLDALWNQITTVIAASNIELVANNCFAMQTSVQNLMNTYTNVASQSNAAVPSQRLNAISQQLVLARQLVNVVLLRGLGMPLPHSSASPDILVTMFEASHVQLLKGGNGLPSVIPERDDLRQQWNNVDQAWSALKAEVFALVDVKPLRRSSLASLDSRLQALILQLKKAVILYGILDPIVPPPPTPFPAELVVFVLLGILLFFFFVVLIWVWRTRGRCHRKVDSVEQGKPEWAMSEVSGDADSVLKKDAAEIDI
jgi:hypothetical protein